MLSWKFWNTTTQSYISVILKARRTYLAVDLTHFVAAINVVGYAEHLHGAVTSADQQIVLNLTAHVVHVQRRHSARAQVTLDQHRLFYCPTCDMQYEEKL